MKKKSHETNMTGIVHGHRDGHGFVVSEDLSHPDIYLAPNEMRAVLHKDLIRVQVVRLDRKGRAEGQVLELLQRSKQPVVGRLVQSHGTWLLEPEDRRYGQDILLQHVPAHAQAGQIAVVQLEPATALYAPPQGHVTEILGDADDPGMEIEIAVRKYGLPHVFSEETLQYAHNLPTTVQPQDMAGRVDLRDIALVTIDGEDARDFDDAVYCEPVVLSGRGKNAKKGWRLLVAIADVSHYVQDKSPLDIDACTRATSVYFPRRVIPMLPEQLSNGLCSLNPHVDRLCMVCDMLVNTQGEVQAYQFYPAVMHSHARFTYTEVAAILANTKGVEAQRHAERIQDVLHLHDVYQALLQARTRRGAMDLETVETQIICDDNGHVDKIVPRTRNDAHKLIEEAMLAANVCAADFMEQHKAIGLYRVHASPSEDKIEILRNYLRSLAIPAHISDQPTTAEFAAIAHATKDRPDALQIHTMLLRSMQQAVYSPQNQGHFGLAFEGYTHFTSPIRRYPDLLVHRVIKAILLDRKEQAPASVPERDDTSSLNSYLRKGAAAQVMAEKPKTPLKGRAAAAWSAWQDAAVHCSLCERRADEASRDVQTWLKCQYTSRFIGEVFAGTVSAVTSFGLFVTLDDMFVEGLVHITELGSDYFRYDDIRQRLQGERTSVSFALGDKVQVQIAQVDVDGRRIDFRLIRAANTALAQKRTGKKSQITPDIHIPPNTQQQDSLEPTKTTKTTKTTQASTRTASSAVATENLPSPLVAAGSTTKKANKPSRQIIRHTPAATRTPSRRTAKATASSATTTATPDAPQPKKTSPRAPSPTPTAKKRHIS